MNKMWITFPLFIATAANNCDASQRISNKTRKMLCVVVGMVKWLNFFKVWKLVAATIVVHRSCCKPCWNLVMHKMKKNIKVLMFYSQSQLHIRSWYLIIVANRAQKRALLSICHSISNSFSFYLCSIYIYSLLSLSLFLLFFDFPASSIENRE